MIGSMTEVAMKKLLGFAVFFSFAVGFSAVYRVHAAAMSSRDHARLLLRNLSERFALFKAQGLVVLEDVQKLLPPGFSRTFAELDDEERAFFALEFVRSSSGRLTYVSKDKANEILARARVDLSEKKAAIMQLEDAVNQLPQAARVAHSSTRQNFELRTPPHIPPTLDLGAVIVVGEQTPRPLRLRAAVGDWQGPTDAKSYDVIRRIMKARRGPIVANFDLPAVLNARLMDDAAGYFDLLERDPLVRGRKNDLDSLNDNHRAYFVRMYRDAGFLSRCAERGLSADSLIDEAIIASAFGLRGFLLDSPAAASAHSMSAGRFSGGGSGGGVEEVAAAAASSELVATTTEFSPEGDYPVRKFRDFSRRGSINTADPVTQDDFDGDSDVIALPCGHLYLPESVQGLKENGFHVCSVCREPFKAEPTSIERDQGAADDRAAAERELDDFVSSLPLFIQIGLADLPPEMRETFKTLVETTAHRPGESQTAKVRRLWISDGFADAARARR